MNANQRQRAPAAANAPLKPVEIEIFPAKGAFQKAVDNFPSGATLAISVSPTHGMDPTLKLQRRLAEAGFAVIPHLTARVFRSREQLREVVAEVVQSGAPGINVLGGDPPEPWGPFSAAVDVLKEIADMGHKFGFVGIGGYPQGHPLISEEALLQALKDKQPYATHILTQLCFDPRAFISWLERIRGEGIKLPVLVGVPAPMQALRLIGFAAKCGVSDARMFLRAHLGMIGNFLRPSYSPDKLVAQIGKSGGSLGVEGLHVFTFNQFEATRRWLDRNSWAGHGH